MSDGNHKRKRESVSSVSSVTNVSTLSQQDTLVTEDHCAICFDTAEPGKSLVPCKPAKKTKGCTAKFCGDCLETWVNRKIETEGTDATCPTCRAIIRVCPENKRFVTINSLPHGLQNLMLLEAVLRSHIRNYNTIRNADVPVSIPTRQALLRPPAVPQRPPDGSRFFTCKTCRPRQPTRLEEPNEPPRRFAEIGSILSHIAEHHPRLRLLEFNAEQKIVCIHHRDEVIEPTIEAVILHYTSHGHDIKEIEQRIGVKLLT